MKILINNNDLYYEKIGTGKPLILLHGNEESSEIFFEAVGELKKTNTVYLIDQRHHGKSSKNGSLTYEDMRDDLKLFILSLGIIKPTIFGFSDGGIVGLMLAIKNEELIDRLVLAGINVNPKGLKFNLRFIFSIKNFFKPSIFYKLMLKGPIIKKDDLLKLTCSIKLLYGEKDVISKRHLKLLKKVLPKAQFYYLKNENHYSYVINKITFIDYL